MEKAKLDTLDNEIVCLLTENGRMSIGEMTKKLKVTAPTIRSRVKNLEKIGLFKISGLIDPDQHHEMITALVAISVRASEKMDRLLDKLPNCQMLPGQELLPDDTI